MLILLASCGNLQSPYPLLLVLTGRHNRIMPQAGNLNNRNLSSHSSGGWKSKSTVPAGLVSSENPLPGLQTAAFSLGPHVAERQREIPGISSSYEDTSPVGLGTYPHSLVYLNYLL